MAAGGDDAAQQAELRRIEGNACFKKARLGAAIDCYTEAIALCPDVAVYWMNRALCHFKRKEWARVEEDSRRALALDDKLVKVLVALLVSLGCCNATSSCHPAMVIWSCSSSLRGFISRAAWRRHYPLLSLRHHVPLPIQFFSSSRRSTKKSATQAPIESSKEPFYVIHKGGVIGIYKTLSDCQAQVSSSVCDPSVTVYKGYSLRKETEEYLAAHGLRNTVYTIHAADARDELFGDLVPCPFQQPDETAQSALKRSQEMETGPSEHPKVAEQDPLPDSKLSCILEFDGACKGNPGKSGAGVIIRRLDGSVIAQLREGLGITTNNAAEYRALILGLNYASKKGFKYIRAQGDSKLVCNQVQDLWRARSDNMVVLCSKAKKLKGTFLTFQINHVLREFNSDADAQANIAVELAADEVQELSVC